MIERRETRTVKIGNISIGSGHAVAIQSMAKTRTSDVAATVKQIRELEDAGCEIVRVAVRDTEDAKAIADIREEVSIPLVADIHFDHRLALESLKSGADKIRINPGNITDLKDVDKIINAASSVNIPIRIGVNSGSIPAKDGRCRDIAGSMADLTRRYIEHFQKRRFDDLVISVKASDVNTTVRAYKKIAAECDYPLHLGITAAGLPEDGIVKSSIGLGALLMEGLGDTIRVSLTGDPVPEVYTAKRILTSIGLRYFGPQIISCPVCGRCQVDLASIVRELEKEVRKLKGYSGKEDEKQLLIAVMGCEVNGPGEAKDADIGIAFGKGKGAIFRKGEIVKTVSADSAIIELLAMIKEEM